jgi:hypothetical protein
MQATVSKLTEENITSMRVEGREIARLVGDRFEIMVLTLSTTEEAALAYWLLNHLHHEITQLPGPELRESHEESLSMVLDMLTFAVDMPA